MIIRSYHQIDPIERWKEIIHEQTDGSSLEVANRILGDLVHYRDAGSYRSSDIQTLAYALEAFRQLQEKSEK